MAGIFADTNPRAMREIEELVQGKLSPMQRQGSSINLSAELPKFEGYLMREGVTARHLNRGDIYVYLAVNKWWVERFSSSKQAYAQMMTKKDDAALSMLLRGATAAAALKRKQSDEFATATIDGRWDTDKRRVRYARINRSLSSSRLTRSSSSSRLTRSLSSSGLLRSSGNKLICDGKLHESNGETWFRETEADNDGYHWFMPRRT